MRHISLTRKRTEPGTHGKMIDAEMPLEDFACFDAWRLL